MTVISEGYEVEEILLFLRKLEIIEPLSIYLFIKDGGHLKYDEIIKLKTIPQLMKVYLFNSKIELPKSYIDSTLEIISIQKTFVNYTSFVQPEKLLINNEIFFEALNHNSYYHKKLYIDGAGNMKNGHNCVESFGSINQASTLDIIKIIASKRYYRLGEVLKSDISVCEVCEFRYMCSDPRIPDKGNLKWYHKQECSYNPYISKWNFEEGYKTLAEIGVVIDNNTGTTIIDNEKLEQYNQFLWENY